MNHSFGYVPDKEDIRDFKFSEIHEKVELPVSVDLRKWCSPVRDQGNLGACTGFAGEALKEFLQNRDKTSKRILSPRFLYYCERVLMGTVNEDSGASIRDIFKVLNKTGISHEDCCPYQIERFAKKPSLLAYAHGLLKRIKKYSRLYSVEDVKQALAQNKGVIFGFYVYESFGTVGKDGLMPIPKSGEEKWGGHAVFVCGYDDIKKVFIVKNSWGTEWGSDGYFFFPYEAFNTVIDAWTGE